LKLEFENEKDDKQKEEIANYIQSNQIITNNNGVTKIVPVYDVD